MAMTEAVDVLAESPVLAGESAAELEALCAAFEARAADAGEVLVRQGEPSGGFGVIVAGQASVRVDGQERTRLGPGDFFGEISALLGEAAMADVTALGPVCYLHLDQSRCEAFCTAHPKVTYRLLQAEARRLRSPERWYAGTSSEGGPAGWTPDSWRDHPASQQPDWPDRAAVDEVVRTLSSRPPLVFAGEARRLTSALAEVAAGRAFLLQAGDCAESFDEYSGDHVRDLLKVTLQMSAVLTYGAGVHVVKVGRIAGQFAKPRSSPVEVVDGTEIPSFRGHIINDHAPEAGARRADPTRMLRAYQQSVETLNLLRALTTGGFAGLANVHLWNQEFVASSREGQRYAQIAGEIERALRFMRACGFDLDNAPLSHQTDYWTSHEALLLPYEEALTRRDSITGEWFDCSAHMLWIGERTRQLDSAHLEFLSGVENPLGCKLGPTTTAAEVTAICQRLNPRRIPGRLTLVSRMGADRVAEMLPPLLAAARDAGHPVVWACDPMHGNTRTAAGGRKTRRFDDVVAEIQGFFAACASEGVWPGGLHVELTGDDVTECLGGAEEIFEEDLDTNYATTCDPRLNGRQSIDLAFRVAELLLLPGRRPLRQSITSLHTLGPAGTNCELAARKWFEQQGIDGEVVLYPTFEEAADRVVAVPGAALLSCVAYPELHTVLYSHLEELVLVDCLIIPTHEMVLATRTAATPVRSVASHPAPASLAPRGADLRLSTSNSQAAQECASGLVDACITTRAAMEDHGLHLARDFGAVAMGFTVHAQRDSEEQR